MTEEDAIPLILGRNLRRLRTRRGLSLERLAQSSGVSRAMLGQIELGRSVPTVTVLWKIARALEVGFAALTSLSDQESLVVLRHDETAPVETPDGAVCLRVLSAAGSDRRVDLREIALKPGGTSSIDRHPDGTTAHLVVVAGAAELSVGARSARLEPRDAAIFDAGQRHIIRNAGDRECLLYLIASRSPDGAA